MFAYMPFKELIAWFKRYLCIKDIHKFRYKEDAKCHLKIETLSTIKN